MTFDLGQMYITAAAQASLDPADVFESIQRHALGDWGDVGKEDWEENELSVRAGFRVLSSYTDRRGTKFWIITEADRSLTTVLLPSDY